MIRPISAESDSDPLVMQMESSNCPPIHVGLGIFAVFFRSLFHRLLSSTFVGLLRSRKPFLESSTELMKVSMRSVMLVMGADIILVLVALRDGYSRKIVLGKS